MKRESLSEADALRKARFDYLQVVTRREVAVPTPSGQRELTWLTGQVERDAQQPIAKNRRPARRTTRGKARKD